MNERIEKLVTASFPGKSLGVLLMYSPELEKFAELIVKECMLQCEPEAGLRYSPNSLSSRMDCREKIKQHFGVEE